MQYPVWVWVVSVLVVIVAGIGLGYLIIYLFWKIVGDSRPKMVVRENVQLIDDVEESFSPVEEQMFEDVNSNYMEQKAGEEIAPIMAGASSSERNQLIKFTYVLHSRFNHPFEKADTIVCWDIALEDGDEVRDTKGNIMKLRMIEPQSEAESARYILVDEVGSHTILVILGKEYLKRETNLDLDKAKMVG